jgi:hypothetical protein
MLETQLAQLAALVPSPDNGRIPGQPVSSCENVSVVSTKWGKPPRKTHASDYARKPMQQILDPWEESIVVHKKDPGYPTITCTIYHKKIRHALCDLGASINLMSKAMFEQLGYPTLSPRTRTIQLADSRIQYPEGIAESLLVKVKGSYVFADFMVLDMDDEGGMPLILGRPFLSDVRARINVGSGIIRFRIGERNLSSSFRTRKSNAIWSRIVLSSLGKDGAFNPEKEISVKKGKENLERMAED